MTHSIHASDTDGALPYFQRLGRTLFAPNIDPNTRLEELFEHETVEFDMEYAFLSEIDLETESERFKVVHGSHEVLKSNTTVPLSKSYCRETITHPEGTLAVSDAPAQGWRNDPAYELFGFGSYLGTTVSVANEIYGTLSFADSATRGEPFTENEKALVGLYGQWVGYMLSYWDESVGREPRIDSIERCALSSEAIDSMMDVLSTRTRRVILMTLLGDSTETSIATLERRLNPSVKRIHLHHNHLPKLANSGYINWDDETDTISKGPKFSEVEPLVQLLNEYEAEFSA